MSKAQPLIYRGYDVKVEDDGRYSIWKDGNHVYTLTTTTTEEAALAWIDVEKKRQRGTGA